MCILSRSRSAPTDLAPLRDFSHIQAEFIDRFVPFIQNGMRYKALQRTTELRGPAEDIVEFRQLQRLRFDPRIRGLTAHAFAARGQHAAAATRAAQARSVAMYTIRLLIAQTTRSQMTLPPHTHGPSVS